MAKPASKRKKEPEFSDHVLAALSQTTKRLAATWREWLPQVLLIAFASLWIYSPALHGDFIWDDSWYISNNFLLHDSGGLWKFWFQPGSWLEYYPIEETVLWLQWQLWGNDPLGYHLTNVVLHVIDALLVWKLLGKLRLRFAWVGGLLFAIHPVNVESVAWMVELKNTLSLMPLLLAMCAWVDFEERKENRDYWLALGLFLAAILCKMSVAPFPAVLLLYACWKRGRIGWSDVKASAPFFVVALIFIRVALGVGPAYSSGVQLGPNEYLPIGGLLSQMAVVGLSIAFYFGNVFAPFDFVLIHPAWIVNPPSAGQFIPWILFAFVATVSFWKYSTWGRHVLLALGFFLIFLIPVLNFGRTFHPRDTWVMNHFLYIPIVGLIGLVVAAMGNIYLRLSKPVQSGAIVILVVVVALLAFRSHGVAATFANEEAIWTYNLRFNPNSSLAHHNLGCYFLDKQRYPEAILELKEAIRLNPQFDQAYYNLGYALEKSGRPVEAEAQYRQAVAINPGQLTAWLNLGQMMKQKGNIAEAESLFREGLKNSPGDPSLTVDLGALLIETKRMPEALALEQSAAELHPDVFQLQHNFGIMLLQSGALGEAASHLEKAAELDPKAVGVHTNLGVIYAQTRRLPEAIDQFEMALQLDPNVRNVRVNLATALVQIGRIPEALEQARLAAEADPHDARAHDLLTKLQQFNASH